MENTQIDLQKILRESRETLLNPKDYFTTLSLSGGYAEPVIKAVIYGTVAGIFALLWSLTGFSNMGAMILGGAVGIMALIGAIIASVVGVLVGGAIMLVLSAICGGNTDFESNLRVTASLMVLYPINAFLAFLSGINLTLSGLVSLLVGLYSVYLIYHALILSLKARESSVRIVAIVLVVLSLIGFMGNRRATKSIEDFSDMFEQEQLD